ncbi:MAG: S1 RNA-binding domain-containing protein, partial [Synechococcaceae cyanobacterium]|nr:S1 RNA-binding domain-containing protein [Synechococcaceae cyanobacterium]
MTVTPSSELGTVEVPLETLAGADAAADLDLAIPEEVPSADDSSSRGAGSRDSEGVGFTLDEFASLLSKYDYNFKPGDVVNGTVFALEPKGAMIDIGAKTAAFMPLQEVSINRVEHLSDVLEPGEVREFFILSEENEDGQLTLSIRRI